MHITFADKGIVQIDDARILGGSYRNFSGEQTPYNRKGDRNFVILIADEEMAQALMNDKNEYGVGWNVKIKPPREEGDKPFIYLQVKVNFNGRGPKVRLKSGDRVNILDEDSIDILDQIDFQSVDLDIRPFDGEFNGKPFRSAYLQGMYVVQELDRFDERYGSAGQNNNELGKDGYDSDLPF